MDVQNVRKTMRYNSNMSYGKLLGSFQDVGIVIDLKALFKFLIPLYVENINQVALDVIRCLHLYHCLSVSRKSVVG